MRKLYLFFAVLLCAIFGTQSASAWTVYYDNTYTNWSEVKVHYYNGNTSSSWPGVSMAKIADTNIWVYSVDDGKSPGNVIFNNNAGNQTMGDANAFKYNNGYMYQKKSDTEQYSWSPTNEIYLKGSFEGAAWSTKYKFSLVKANGTNGVEYQIEDFTPGSGNYNANDSNNGLKVHVAKINGNEVGWYSHSSYKFTESNTSSTIYTNNGNCGFYLPNTYTVKYNATTKKLSFEKTSAAVTEISRELTKIALLQGGTEVASDTESPYEFSNVSVVNGNTYQIAATYTVTYSDGTTPTETKKYSLSSGSHPTLGTAAALTETTTSTFTFAATGVVNATVAVTDGVPSSVTFTDAAEEEKTITDVYLYKSGGTTEEFTLSNGKYVLDDVTISTSENYYITVKYSNDETLKYMLDAANNIAVVSGTTYNIKERGESEYFNFSSIGSTKIDAELTVADNAPATVKFTAVPTDDPVETAYADIWLVDMNGNKLAHFTQNSTYPYIWTFDAYKINTASNDNDKSGHYRFRIYTSETDATQYSEFSMGDNYGYLGNYDQTEKYGLKDVTGNNTASFGLPANTYYFAVTTYGGDLFDAKISTSTIDLSKLTDPTPEVEEDETSELLNMPLKKRDFDNGKVHYFVVGTRMSEWRLQPEWELLDEDGDGTYTLANRLLYNGKMGIAKVENYEDYIHQRYTFYSVNQTISGDETLTLTTKTNPKADVLAVTCAESDNKFTAINYGKDYTKDQFTSSNTIIWGGLGEAPIRTCSPTYVGEISITDNGASGLTMTLSGSTKDASTIAKYRTFSLVGSAVVNADYDDDETCRTPLRNDGSGPTDWQEAWIQYDNYGMPYYDAYGNMLYQTVFQREWLENHPTIFKAEDGFEYNSRNIVFNYDATQTHDAKIPASGEQAWTTKDSSVSSPNKNYSSTVKADEGWQCFVVENMWLGGQFKVWTGWGGADKTQDGSGSNAGDARWYYENGGHHIGSDWTISADKKVYYATDRDINNADFDLGNRIFARYVKVWWDAEEGFDNSFIQLITEVGGPEISCKRNPEDSHSLLYTWQVPNAETLLTNYDVKNIKIIRYRLDSNKNQTELEVFNESYEKNELFGDEVNLEAAVTDELDRNYAEGGYYWYRIIIDYYGNDSAEEKVDFSRDAESNRVYIYYETIPNGATVTQLAYTEPEAAYDKRMVSVLAVDADDETGSEEIDPVAADEAYWSFDLAVNAQAPESLHEQTFEKDNGDGTTTVTPVLSLVKYYVVGVPVATVYTKVLVGGEAGTEVAALTADELAEISSSATALNFDTDTYAYFGLTPDADNYYVMPELLLQNVKPDNYLNVTTTNFTIDMVSSNGDYERWHNVNVSTAKPEVSMYVPTTSYDVTKFAIEKVADGTAEIAPAGDYAPLGMSTAQPVTYHNFNKLQTSDGKINQLMVTNGVLRDWTVAYGLDVTIGTSVGKSAALTEMQVTPVYDNTTLNKEGGVDANFDYLPVSVCQTQEMSGETGIDNIDNWKTRQFDGAGFKVAMTVKYTRTDDAVSVSAENSESTANIGSSNVDNYDKLVAYGDAAMSTNGFTVHNQSAWSSQSATGEAVYYLDAFKVIELNNNDTTLNKAVGYYSGNGYTTSTKYYQATSNGYQPIEAVAGGEVYIETNEESAPFNAFADYDAENDNFAEYAAKVGKLPIKIGMVGEGNASLVGVQIGENKNLYELSDIYTLVTAEYPFLVKPAFVQPVSPASEGGYEMVTLAYPKLVKAVEDDITTDVIDIVADGVADFRIYPNPVVDVVNVAASTELGRIEIYSVDGRLVKVVEADDTHAAVEVGDLVKGSYIIRAAGATQRMIKK